MNEALAPKPSVPSFKSTLDEMRWFESSLLKARFISIFVGAIVFLILPLPQGRWLQLGAIVAWFAAGLIAAAIVRRATSDAVVVWTGRSLLALDFLIASGIIVLYMPTLPDVWGGFLVFIVIAAARARLGGAIFMASLTTALLTVTRVVPNSPETGQWASLLVQLSVTWLVVLTLGVILQAARLQRDAIAEQRVAHDRNLEEYAAMSEAAQAQARMLQQVMDLAVVLLRERNLPSLLARILESTLQVFRFECGAVYVAQRDTETYVCTATIGYPPQIAERLHGRQVSFAQMGLRIDPRFAIRPDVYYAPVERQTWHTDPEFCRNPEALYEARRETGRWHEADLLLFTLQSSSGEIIGVLAADSPADGRVPSQQTLDASAVFVRLAAAAIETVHLVSAEQRRAEDLSEQNVAIRRMHADAQAIAEQRRAYAHRLERILDVSTAIFSEHDLDTLLKRILRLTLDMFGFSGGTILLRDPMSHKFVRRAAVGYSSNVVGEEIQPREVEDSMNERTRVRDTFYYAPKELGIMGGVTRHPDRASLPRTAEGAWHEDDMLIFPIFNSSGRTIGLLSPDDPKDGRVPGEETVRTIEVFAQLAGIAVETARLRAAARQPV